MWGCVDCKEIYSSRDGARVPRSWTTAMGPDGAAAAPTAASATAGSGEPGRFSPGELPAPEVIKAQLDRLV